MNTVDDIKLEEVKGARPQLFTWAKAMIIPAITMILVGSLAILIGRNRHRPVDWVNIHAVGRNRDLKLPDGSRVTLREGSSVAYSSDFGKNHRNLQLSGDAYFRVLNNPAFPFSVQTNQEIKTLGAAAFYISNGNSKEEVLVAEGRLLFAKAPKSGSYFLLRPGESIERTGNHVVRASPVNQNYFAWQTRRLVFNHVPLTEVARDIYNYYGVQMSFDSSFHPDSLFLTSTYNNCTLGQVLADISVKTGVLISWEDNILVIRPDEKLSDTSDLEAKEILLKKNEKLFGKDGVNKGGVKGTKKKKKWWKFWERK
jgi:transmembrane sensor